MIPYYEKHSGIRTPPESETECTCNQYYIVLDKNKVDESVRALEVDIWDIFAEIKGECEGELFQHLDIFEATHALSPEGDDTYILNFIVQAIPDTKGCVL